MSLLQLGLAALLVILPASIRADSGDGHVTTSIPDYRAADVKASAVTGENLLASERFWPYQVALTKSWRPAGRASALPKESVGVLIRVETRGIARIDFGRDGLYDVPIDQTDIVERADRIRRGETDKMAPNFVLAIGPRLLDSSGASLRPFGYSAAAERLGFLCVFVDPDGPDLADMASALSPAQEGHRVLTVVFPQGNHPDGEIREKLRTLKWPVAFVFDHLAEAYSRTLLPEDMRVPAVLLQTREGRVLFQSSWKPGVAPKLISAIDGAFGGGLAAAPVALPPS